MNIENLIKEFIIKIHLQYPELYIAYEYDKETDEYDIWHNSSELEFNSKDFLKYTSEVANELFFNNNIYNFTFAYDHSKSKALKDIINIYESLYENIIKYKYVQKTSDKHLPYDINEELYVEFNKNIEFLQTEKYSKNYSIEKDEGFNLVELNEDTLFTNFNFKEVA